MRGVGKVPGWMLITGSMVAAGMSSGIEPAGRLGEAEASASRARFAKAVSASRTRRGDGTCHQAAIIGSVDNDAQGKVMGCMSALQSGGTQDFTMASLFGAFEMMCEDGTGSSGDQLAGCISGAYSVLAGVAGNGCDLDVGALLDELKPMIELALMGSGTSLSDIIPKPACVGHDQSTSGNDEDPCSAYVDEGTCSAHQECGWLDVTKLVFKHELLQSIVDGVNNGLCDETDGEPCYQHIRSFIEVGDGQDGDDTISAAQCTALKTHMLDTGCYDKMMGSIEIIEASAPGMLKPYLANPIGMVNDKIDEIKRNCTAHGVDLSELVPVKTVSEAETDHPEDVDDDDGSGSHGRRGKHKEDKKKKGSSTVIVVIIVCTVVLLLGCGIAFAMVKKAKANAISYHGLSINADDTQDLSNLEDDYDDDKPRGALAFDDDDLAV